MSCLRYIVRGPGRRQAVATRAGLGVRRLVWALLLAGMVSGAFSTEAWAEEQRVAGATVRWDGGLAALGRAAARALPRVRSQVSDRLGCRYAGPPARVVVVAGYERMKEEARAHVPEWAVGVAVSARGLIVIRADLLGAGFGGGIVPVLRHEWVHLTWGHCAGARRRHLPLWAEEGIAEEIGGGISVDAGAALDLAVTFNRLHRFADLAASFPADAYGADLAYKQSRSWVRHFVEDAGWDTLERILEDLADPTPGDPPLEGESPFEQQIRSHTGQSLGSWHAAWLVALQEEAKPWFHLVFRDFQGLLIAVLALIGATVFFFLARRRRRQIARLPDLPLPERATRRPER